MSIVSGIVVYLCIWWVVIFCVLPIGVTRGDSAPEEGLPAAPLDPKLKQKFIATTMIAALIWVAIFVMIESNMIDFRSMADQMIESHRGS